MNKKPSFDREHKLLNENIELVFGMDEVGRGSFAGPLVASAVSFEKVFKWFKDINDSKLLTHKKRKHLSKLILENSISFTEAIDVKTINKFGIGETNRLVFQKLIERIKDKHRISNIYFLIDGRKTFEYQTTEFIVKGDRKCISIAAASIIAKVHRDNLMTDLGKQFSGYNLSKNKGYGTKFHQKALKKYGLSKIHRTSFNLQKFLD